MHSIDSIANRMIQSFKVVSEYKNIEPMILDYAAAAREECELMKSDPDFFSSWPHFVALGDRITHIDSDFLQYDDPLKRSLLLRGRTLLIDGKNLLSYMAGVRVPMPKSMGDYCQELEQFTRAVETLEISST